MAANPGFCSKCGAQLVAGSAFCPQCGAAVAPVVQTRAEWREQRREQRRADRREKREKGEKREKNEKGSPANMLYALVGGLVLIWLGIVWYFQQIGYLPSDVWGGYFLAGVGVILILDGIVIYSRKGVGLAPVLGGACALVLGVGSILASQLNISQDVWPLVIVALGVLVIVLGVWARSRSPRP